MGALPAGRSELWPTAHLVHVASHASWVNQVEIHLSVIQRECLAPNEFHDPAPIEHRLFAFERRSEQTTTPFEWRFTRSDLAVLMKRLAGKETVLAA